MMKFRLLAIVLMALSAPMAPADDHPELSAADEAYSAEDYGKAATLYRRDAELGVIAAQVNLAYLYLDGQGVDQDFEQARAWFLRAAEKGNKEAQQNLASLYQEGKGVARDWVEADKWFLVAGAKENAAALEKGMSKEQIADAAQRAQAWLAENPQAAGH